MRKEFQKSIAEAKVFISKTQDQAHGTTHAKSVVNFAKEISRGYSDIDSDLIEVAAWWHDVGRLYSEVHEKLSAEMAINSLKNLGVEENICKKVYDAIVFHKWSMQPQTIEGEIVRDADKLDFFSVYRWKFYLESNNIEALQDLTSLLPRLRNELLHLEISKKIYDIQIIKFKKFVGEIDNLDFLEIKNVLSMNL